MDTLTMIRNSVEMAYGSVATPNLHFVDKEYRRNPYSETVRKLRALSFDMVETTDLNEDVSFAYFVRKAAGRWSLQLSLVGRFASLLSVDERNRVSFDGGGEHQLEIQRILSESGIMVLSEEVLSSNIPFGGAGKAKRVYFLLFSEADELPWQVKSD